MAEGWDGGSTPYPAVDAGRDKTLTREEEKELNYKFGTGASLRKYGLDWLIPKKYRD